MRIRKATDADLLEILRWLSDEDARGVEGCFHRNRKSIREAHQDGELYVAAETSENKAVAFIMGGTKGPDILAVREEWRRRGVGQQLAEFWLEEAKQRDLCALEIECEPRTSIGFWQKTMGFEFYDDNYAFKIIEKTFDLPGDAQEVAVVIRFFPERVKGEKSGVEPLMEVSPRAVRLHSGKIALAERVTFFNRGRRGSSVRDPVVEIEVEGALVYRDKAKHDEAKALGVRGDAFAFCIDSLSLPGI